jgi:hypothetical protein
LDPGAQTPFSEKVSLVTAAGGRRKGKCLECLRRMGQRPCGPS